MKIILNLIFLFFSSQVAASCLEKAMSLRVILKVQQEFKGKRNYSGDAKGICSRNNFNVVLQNYINQVGSDLKKASGELSASQYVSSSYFPEFSNFIDEEKLKKEDLCRMVDKMKFKITDSCGFQDHLVKSLLRRDLYELPAIQACSGMISNLSSSVGCMESNTIDYKKRLSEQKRLMTSY